MVSAMSEIVNLHKARKRAAKQRDAERAAANRFQHGRSKAERGLVSGGMGVVADRQEMLFVYAQL